jgi:hypothetical protein
MLGFSLACTTAILPSPGTGMRAIRGSRRCAIRSPVGIERPVIDAINARRTPSLTDARERPLRRQANSSPTKCLSDESYAAAGKTMGLESLVALVATVGSFGDGSHRRHVSNQSAGE